MLAGPVTLAAPTIVGASAHELVAVLVGRGVVFVAVGLVAIGFVVVLSRRSRRPVRLDLLLAAGITVMILAITQLPAGGAGALRVSSFSLTRPFTWIANGWGRNRWFESADWWLNVILFVPFGAAAWHVVGGRSRRRREPIRRALATSAAVVVAFSYGIESLQAFTGLRSADPHDLISNSVGGWLGIGAALGWHRARRSTPRADGNRALQPPSGRAIAVAAVSVVALSIVAALSLSFAADAERDDLLYQLRFHYAATTLADMRPYFFPDADDPGLEPFLAKTSVRPDSVVRNGEASVRVRYTKPTFGLYRCVFVTWLPTSVHFELGTGDECTEFLGS